MEKKKEETLAQAQDRIGEAGDPVEGIPEEAQAIAADRGPEEREETTSFPIVGIGASAGGLAAFEKFFASMPAATSSGMAFVLVQHLDPDHKSILTELVKKYTEMKVFEVVDGMEVQPNCAYIIPPNKNMAFMHGKLHLMDLVAPRGLRLPIDYFFRSLAQDQRERAICIVLSGTGSDGTLGLKEIKGQGGMTMVQDPDSAGYNGMPRSAIATEMVDYVLPPERMPERLIAYVDQVFGKPISTALPITEETTDSLSKIFVLLRNQTGHDFSYYKRNTIHRRVERRMAVNQIDQLDSYTRYLQQNPLEVETLFRDLLIGVTSFFRDPDAFEALKQQAIRPLLAGRDPARPLRVWVPGCATGEEAFSIAMLAQEVMDDLKRRIKVQIFATDIDPDAIDKARTGIYPDSISADVSPERLSRFFHLEDNRHHVAKSIRDMVVFAIQNVIEDPPFSKMDVISCRNLLIYMGPELQKKTVPLFHYSLNPGGFLFLGASETVGEFVDLFSAMDRKGKLFLRIGVPSRGQMTGFALPSRARFPDVLPNSGRMGAEREISIRDLAEKTLLEQHTPPCAIFNERGDVLYIHGRTGRYLEPPPGEASLNIIRMAREGLRLELTNAIRKAIAQKIPIRSPGLEVRTNGDTAIVDLLVTPVMEPDAMPGLYMVVFNDATPKKAQSVESGPLPSGGTDQRIAGLERELRTKEEYLQTTIEELETTNEELKSTNEELQSSNEELQSTNEELETSREELQSVNEELQTVNAELQEKIDALSQANNDMNNLLAGTGVGTIFVDNNLIIRRFSQPATSIINLIKTDIGRPVRHIVSNLVGYNRLVEDIQAVLDNLSPRQAQVQTTAGSWYLMNILPYRTLANVIAGAVITFVDITEQKRLQDLSRLAIVVRDSNDAITVQDFKGNILAWNPGAERMYGWSEGEALAMSIRDLIPKDKREEALTFVKSIARGEEIPSLETQRVTKDSQVLNVWITATKLLDDAGEPYAIATTERDVARSNA